MGTACLLGTLDTKGEEYGFVAKALQAVGTKTLLIDVGVLGEPTVRADVTREQVAEAAGMSLNDARNQRDRGSAIAAMARGAAKLVTGLVERGEIDGILSLGGTGGTTLASEVMRALPVGFPKLIVSTVASGETRHYVGAKDITMMYSIVDIAGINAISSRILTNAAGAIAGMTAAEAPDAASKPLIAATMFGLTTPAVDAARRYLEQHGYEVLVFHATGTGGDSMEAIIESGLVVGVLDITTTELADELAGGVFAASPTRLTAAGRAGVPAVVSLGALDMVNFGPADTVPDRYRDRRFYYHNDSVTLMRTNAAELAEVGKRMASRLNARPDHGSITVFIPEGGFSGIDVPGGAFEDSEADSALVESLTAALDADVHVVRAPVAINDEAFAIEMARTLDLAIRNQGAKPSD